MARRSGKLGLKATAKIARAKRRSACPSRPEGQAIEALAAEARRHGTCEDGATFGEILRMSVTGRPARRPGDRATGEGA